MSTTTKTEHEVLHTIQVRDPNGHRIVFLEGLGASATMAEIQARAMSELRLTEEVEWNIRQDSTGRLLQEDQRLGALAGSEPQITLSMQPDAGLG